MIPYFLLVIIILGIVTTTTLIAIKALYQTKKDMHEKPIPILISSGILFVNLGIFIATLWQIFAMGTKYNFEGFRFILQKQSIEGFSMLTPSLLMIIVSAFFTMSIVIYLKDKKE